MVRGELATQRQRDNLGRLLGRRSTEGELAQAMHTEGMCLGGIHRHLARAGDEHGIHPEIGLWRSGDAIDDNARCVAFA